MTNAIANVEQARNWDSEDGAHWTEHEDLYNKAVARHYAHFLRAAAVATSDRVLDIGCGTGESTRDAARAAPAGSALGVDLSSAMLERARERARAEGLTNVTFELADAQVHPFAAASFDIAISRYGSMFFADPVAAFRNVATALRPGGRLTLLAWQALENNDWLLRVRAAFAAGRDLPGETPGKPGPFGLADPDQVRRILGDAGFTGITLDPSREAMCFGRDLDRALALWRTSGLSRGLLGNVDDATRAKAFDALRDTLREHMRDGEILMDSAAWVITARNG